jgi:hypothetical protein
MLRWTLLFLAPLVCLALTAGCAKRDQGANVTMPSKFYDAKDAPKPVGAGAGPAKTAPAKPKLPDPGQDPDKN